MDASKLSGTQKIVFPTVMNLSEKGHLGLAIKILVHATRVDFAVLRRNAARARYTRKLERLMEATDRLEAQACTILHPEHQ